MTTFRRVQVVAGKTTSMVGNGLEMTYRPIFSADRKMVSVSLNPVFQTLDRSAGAPKILNPAIPGR